ncbi:xanthine dehydrogenase family protein subunit M [Acidaminobacter sp. JC074]|uniref:FAD binding domain-containing protein n=1 Tax=Acidaminobacter sp. JC074 TaxID=2530199 RepID=UPI001F10B86C|nr:FAD binding domain-containing protein [Acidaminobacter sp. JC074]MCH4889760.1 xanthine dehydrogenase family protein subunit M [Acidaminobacter sp. JC074]
MFNTYRPDTFDQVLDILDKETCHIFAGGTDLMIRKRQWQGAERKFTQSVVYISHLKELAGIVESDDYYEIGTLTTQTDIVDSDLPDYIRVPYSLMSSPAIRNVATVGGNIVNAASVADSLPIFYALDAKVELVSKYGRRLLPVEEFVLGKYKTARQANEILTKVIVPKFKEKGFSYKKIGQRKASILSKLSVFMVYNESDLRIAIGAVNDTVIRNRALEVTYKKDKNIDDLIQGYKSLMFGQDDKRSTKDYRERVTENLIRSFLKEMEDEL